uniref:Bacterial bifunctional deaminase-reductase C-terminal domain-containing protein n=1 Tax=Acrobeloides nanus TaxID=290746 RepID=A0A914E291_9BILA
MKIILNLAVSSDGFIADKDGGTGWLPEIDEELNEQTKFQEFMDSVSIILMGRKKTYVFSSRQHESRPEVEFTKEDVGHTIKRIRSHDPEVQVWLMGGAELAKSFFENYLVDEVVLTVIPVKRGEGIKLAIPEDKMVLKEKEEICRGIVQEYYVRCKK